MKLLLGFFAALLCVVESVSFFDLVGSEWQAYKAYHGKKYQDSTEEKFRMKIYMENRHKIAQHNKEAQDGKHSYTLEMNEYGDLLQHEFVGMMNGFRSEYNRSKPVGATFLSPSNVKVPDSIDWREKGYVTAVKNQGQCGSCWSFSTTGALEGQNFRKTGKLVSLSEQNLIDCSSKYGNHGCQGGLMDYAFEYIKENRGIDTEESYPYEAKDAKCRFKKKNVGAKDVGFVDVQSESEQQLQHATATVGPISVAIDANHQEFQFYSQGVYYNSDCSSTELDHGVLVVGYGTDEASGQDYWLVKNSWGPEWGDQGYIKMARNRNNNCGIATTASYPLV